ncbi:hypothetical protein [Microbacterium forte]|uniref:hypothetical protein n=1 Tax=Microbacterium forte TaxID=2982533 RepID=UPI002892C626|nr:hypothetical protein [Microbacterium sp. A(2022)]
MTATAPTDNRIGFADRLALSAKLWDASDAFTIESTLWTGQAQADCRRSARQLATTARYILSGAISVAEAEAFTEASRKALGQVAGARRLRDSLRAPQKRQNGSTDA